MKLIYIDIIGPFPIGLKGQRYIQTFIDDYTRSTWIYLIKFKSSAIDTLYEFQKMIYNQLGYNIQRIRADNAGEYQSNEWKAFIKEKGIIMEFTAPYSPQQNGIAERFNRTLLERLIVVITAKNIPKFLWSYIAKSVAYIKNRTYSKTINKTPYEALL
jgi:transposase InsO family protein